MEKLLMETSPQMYQFYLTVNENNLDGATAFGDLDAFKLMFSRGW